jgi:DNA-binding NtrC family response regulator
VEKFLVLNGGQEGWIRERGTLFLHQLEELAPEAQKALGYYLEKEPESGTSHRIIASASPLIFQRRDRGLFQKALFYRLSVHLFEVPPLRMRPEDIPALVRHFLKQIDPALRLDPTLLDLFQRYAWPGNLLELRNLLQQMALNAEGPLLQSSDLPEWFLRALDPQSGESSLRERSF